MKKLGTTLFFSALFVGAMSITSCSNAGGEEATETEMHNHDHEHADGSTHSHDHDENHEDHSHD